MIVSPTPENLEKAAIILKQGGLVGMPTETVYGLAADATNEEAVHKIFNLKGRPTHNPLIVHFARGEDAIAYADFSSDQRSLLRYRLLMQSKIIPGPLSCLLPASSKIAPSVCAGLSTICVRTPLHEIANTLISLAGVPLAAPSANRSTELSPSTAAHVLESFGNTSPVIIDGGACAVGLESTVIDLTSEIITILRPGALSAEILATALQERVMYGEYSAKEKPKSPGLLLAHYKTKTPLCWLDEWGEQGDEKLGLILFSESSVPFAAEKIRYATRNGDLDEASKNLYAILHELDSYGLSRIVVERCQTAGAGIAIIDRLEKSMRQGHRLFEMN